MYVKCAVCFHGYSAVHQKHCVLFADAQRANSKLFTDKSIGTVPWDELNEYDCLRIVNKRNRKQIYLKYHIKLKILTSF